MSRSALIALAACALGALATAAPVAAQAQGYPSRPIRLIVPFPAGGPVDVMGRLVGQALTTALGQQVLIDNRPGAGSTLAGRAAAAAEPDGYTLMVGSAGVLAIGPTLYTNAGYDPLKSFAPVAFVSAVPYVMITRPHAPQTSVRDLVTYAKANPGKLNFGVPNGAPPHMLAATFRTATATDIVIVPYRGAANVITDLIGGQVDLGFETTSVTFAHIHEGTVRALGVTTTARLPELPDVPTMAESGIDLVASSWTGIMAPAGTPRAVIETLNRAINEGLRTPAMQARLRQLAAVSNPGTPEDFAAFVAQEVPKWSRMTRLSGAQGE